MTSDKTDRRRSTLISVHRSIRLYCSTTSLRKHLKESEHTNMNMWNPYRNIVDSWKRQHTSFGKMAVVLFYSYVWLFMVASVIQMINPIGQGWEYLVPTTTTEEGKVDLQVYFAWLIQLSYAYLFALALLAESVGPRVSSLVVLTLGTCIVAMFNIRTKNMLGSMGMDQDIEAIWTGVVQLDMTVTVWSILALVLLLVDVQIGSGTTAEETQALV
jgi:hypothetical protein